jgi:hypothetical protein
MAGGTEKNNCMLKLETDDGDYYTNTGDENDEFPFE